MQRPAWATWETLIILGLFGAVGAGLAFIFPVHDFGTDFATRSQIEYVTQQVQPVLTGQYCKQAQKDAQAAIAWAQAHAEQDPAGALKRLREVTEEIARICPDIK